MAILSAKTFTREDVEGVVFREPDVDECAAAGLTVLEAVMLSQSASLRCWAVEVDGEVAAFWGYTVPSFINGVCVLWLLTTPVVEKHKVKFCRTTQRAIRELAACYPYLECLVDDRYLDSKKWLSWLGFKEVGVDDSYSVSFKVMRRG